jgi:hypothetical protein
MQLIYSNKGFTMSSSAIRLYSPAVSWPLLPLLDYPDIVKFLSTCKSAQRVGQCLSGRNNFLERLERSIFSRIEIFDRTHYLEYWGVEITDEFDPENIDIQVLRTFLKTLYSKNPIGEGRVKDACLIPTVIPEKVMVVGRVFDFNLLLLGQLAEYPQGKGHKAGYAYHQTPALERHGADGVDRTCIVILFKGVIARSRSWEDQVQELQTLNDRTGLQFETKPGAVEQNTILFTQHALETGEDENGDRPFGDATGMEGTLTAAHTRELVRYEQGPVHNRGDFHMVSGCFSAVPMMGPPLREGLFVHGNYGGAFGREVVGIGIQRKFELIGPRLD